EDHVSMGTIAARKARQIIENVRNVLSIEIIAAVQGIDLRENGFEKLSFPNKTAHHLIRSKVPFYAIDREHYVDFDNVSKLIFSGNLLKEVEKVSGKLD
ncbi:MAG: aromatic amino acid lyase, partial [Patescibacteria group bacterium]